LDDGLTGSSFTVARSAFGVIGNIPIDGAICGSLPPELEEEFNKSFSSARFLPSEGLGAEGRPVPAASSTLEGGCGAADGGVVVGTAPGGDVET